MVQFGYLKKKGAMLWKQRFFVLNKGFCNYFEREEYPGSSNGINPCGDLLFLVDFSISSPSTGKLQLLVPNEPEAKQLMLDVGEDRDGALQAAWIAAFKAHIKYAKLSFFGEAQQGVPGAIDSK